MRRILSKISVVVLVLMTSSLVVMAQDTDSLKAGVADTARAAGVADAAAAKCLYGSPVIVVDFGTATNIEIIDKTGTFVGGIIAPGVDSSMRSLLSRAALLRSVELEDPGTAIGTNTADALKVGVVYGEAARVDGLVERVFDQLGYEARVVATGGLAHRIAPASKHIAEINLELTLQGLRMIYDEIAQ